jgi:ribosomal protein L24E
MTEAVCAFCGKSVKSEEIEVREGEKVFHLNCYRLFKRRRPGTADVTPRLTT